MARAQNPNTHPTIGSKPPRAKKECRYRHSIIIRFKAKDEPPKSRQRDRRCKSCIDQMEIVVWTGGWMTLRISVGIEVREISCQMQLESSPSGKKARYK